MSNIIQGWIMNNEIGRNIRPKVSHTSTQGFRQKGVQPSYGNPFLEEIQGNCTFKISYDFYGKTCLLDRQTSMSGNML